MSVRYYRKARRSSVLWPQAAGSTRDGTQRRVVGFALFTAASKITGSPIQDMSGASYRRPRPRPTAQHFLTPPLRHCVMTDNGYCHMSFAFRRA
jgi:hypothetical protein